MARDTFEIYYFQNGRWSVHASYEGNERDLALAEAQKVDKTLGFPVRLVRETFYPETNTSEEVVSWQSPKAKQLGDSESMFGATPKPAPKKPKPTPPPAPKRKVEEAAAPPAPVPKKVVKKASKKRASPPGGRGVATKLAIVVAMSLAYSMLVEAVAAFAVYVLTDEMHVLSPDQDRTVLFAGLFVVSYVMSAIRQLFIQFDLHLGWRPRRKASAEPSAADMIRRMQTQKAAPKSDGDGFSSAETVVAQRDIQELRDELAREDAEDEADRTGADDFATAVHESQPTAPVPEPAVAAPASQPAEPAKAAPQKPEPAPERAPPKPAEKRPDMPDAEARQGFSGFVRDVMTAANRDNPQLNAFARFGLNLYLAGACAIMGQAKKVGRAGQLAMLRDGLVAAGNSAERAENFCAELPSYGKNPRYAGMVQAGSAAMSRHLAGQGADPGELSALLNEWGKPEKRSTVPSSFTFLFTDIVNSTALTSQLGNAGAQRVVRAHNTAVRGAIQAQGGREVKHTGDGIMATFPSPLAAVQAAIQAQREIGSHSASNPSVAFNVRIGINVGEAVEEDNDFFGAAVQMTARICSVCTPANIWVSRAVVDACKGQRVGFIPRGAFQMKGIQQARPLYEVAYTDAHKNEIANL